MAHVEYKSANGRSRNRHPSDTFVDAILNRIVHNGYRLELDGSSVRKLKANEQAQSEIGKAAKDVAGSAAAALQKSVKGGPR